MRTVVVALSLLVVVPLFGFGLWYSLYPEPWDPKGPSYVLWKAGLNPFENIDYAISGVLHDPDGNELVAGKSEERLRKTFGYLLTPSQAGPFLERCFIETEWMKGKKARYVRHTRMLILFDRDVATEYVYMKPC